MSSRAFGQWVFSWLRFIAGAEWFRRGVSFVSKHSEKIKFAWVFQAFLFMMFFGHWVLKASPNETIRLIFSIPQTFFGTDIAGLFVMILGFLIGLIFPLMLIGFPLLPLVLAGAAMWVVIIPLAGLALTGLAPFAILAAAKSFLVHSMAMVLAETDAREREQRAVLGALGLAGGSLRAIDGKARLMGPDEFARLTAAPLRGASLFVGQVNGTYFSTATEKHVLVVASTRGGKGRDLIIPNLYAYPGSVFVLDPKGENAARTHERRAKRGPVHVLDPFGVSGLPSARFNPLAKLATAGEMMVTDAQMLADALIEGDNDHWTSSARGLLTGLILYVATRKPSPIVGADGRPVGKAPARDLPAVRALLMRDLRGTLEAIADDPAAPQEARDVADWGLTAAEEEWASIVSNAIEQTKWLASPQIQAVLADGGQQVDFDAYKTGVQSVFLCLPAPYFRTFNKWLRLVVAASLDTLTKQLNPDMPHPTRFVLDEVAQLGNLEKIESALTLSAGYGVQLWGIWQHLKDIDRCYPRSGIAGWVSSSGIRLVFATQDNESIKYFAGQTSEAMTEADIRHLGPGQMLCLMDGQNPLIVDRMPGPG